MADLSAAIAAFRAAHSDGSAEDVYRTGKALLAALDAAQGEAVAWPKADDSAKELGWSWDYKWLESLADATRAAGWDASMEAIDFVLSRVAAPQAPPAAVPASDPPVMDLIGRYWDLAYTEGKTGVSQGDAAGEVLHKIRCALAPPAAVPEGCVPVPVGALRLRGSAGPCAYR